MTRTALLLLLCAVVAPPALAFHRHLTSEQVRDAYFIGRDQNHREAFFAAYRHVPTLLKTGPDVELIEFRTPYEQIALRARDSTDDYFSQDAEQEYKANPNESVIVSISIYETPTFSFPFTTQTSPAYYVRDFQFRVSQDRRIISLNKPAAEKAVAIWGSRRITGVEVRLHFAASQFNSDDPATVEVIAPGGQTYSTIFEVAQLK